jgi:hypothetical protein
MCDNEASDDGKYGFCFVKYSDESKQLCDWVQCQGKKGQQSRAMKAVWVSRPEEVRV